MLVLGSLVYILSSGVFADQFARGELTARLYGGESIYFGISPQPAETCSYWGEHFVFDGATSGGKNMLSMLLTAKHGNYKVHVWYKESSTPSVDQDNGCRPNTMARVYHIAVVDP